MHPIRFAIIGCGMIADAHAYAIKQARDAELVACCSASPQTAAAFAARWHIDAHDDLDALLARDDIDAVCICTPSGLHAPQALAAIARGKHVVIEKPMALSLEDADAVIAAADREGVQACVISQMRFMPAVQALRGALSAGAFGRVVSAGISMKYYRTLEYYDSSAWRGTWAMDGGGALMNQGIHGVDLLLYLAGPVRQVSAAMRTQTRPIETEDSVVAALEFADGFLGTLEASTAAFPGYPRRLEICGEQGSAVLEEGNILRWDLPCPQPPETLALSGHQGASDPKAIGLDSHVRQLQNLVDAIAGRDRLLVDAREGRKALALVLGIYEAARRGERVRIG